MLERGAKMEIEMENVHTTALSGPFVEPSDNDTLWRYMNFAKFMDLLKNGLFFPNTLKCH